MKTLVELENNTSIYLIFRNGSVKNILSKVTTREDDDLMEEEITELFLSAPKLYVTHDSKNVVQNVEKF